MQAPHGRRAATSRSAVLGIAACFATLFSATAIAQEDPPSALFADLPSDSQALADAIVEDIVAIRGLELKEPIAVAKQSIDDFEDYLDEEIDRSLPPERAEAFGRVVDKLGLYRGPAIENIAELMKFVITSQAAAYYDPDNSTFFVLIEDTPALMTGTIYAHELYHGLQDQYFDLDAYLLDAATRTDLNDDQLLARQAVVEGEATYIMTLWATREMTGQVPSGFALDLAVQMQSQLDVAGLRDMLESGAIPDVLGEDTQAMTAATEEIPPFLIETLVGAYLKGMAFVHRVVKDSWDGAEKLYTDPPQSTEQILHPEKWLERDDPVLIERTASAAQALEGWDLLDSNVIGEVQWRIIFNEHGMRDRSPALAAGWDGDRYAVLERDGELLLLLYTTWDSEAEAVEFAAGYEALLAVKYADVDEPTVVDVRGTDVLIVEGGDRRSTVDYLHTLGRWVKE